jgi:hypothetical protein
VGISKGQTKASSYHLSFAMCEQMQESSLSKVKQFLDKTAAAPMGAKKGLEAYAWCVA